ncbi:MAG: OmpP1/FadL family transporter [Gemmatimonadaceae bacterium]
MTFRRALRPLLALAVLLPPGAARAQAFAVNEIGSCAVARSYAVVGAPCADASTIFWNPAYASRLSGWSVLAGGAAIDLVGEFERDTLGTVYETTVPLLPVPHLFVNYNAPNSRRSVGLGVYVPYGLTMEWGDDFPGRFQAQRASIATIYVQPNVAIRINDSWSVGLGPIVGHSTVELKRSIDLSEQPTTTPGVTFAQLGIARRTEFARAELEGSAFELGGQLAVHGRLSPMWTVGARFMLPMFFEYAGDVTFTQVQTGLVLGGGLPPSIPAGTEVDDLVRPSFTAGPLVPQGVRTKIVHPAQIQAGFGYTGFPNLTLAVDYAWMGWKNLNQIIIDFEGAAPDATLIQDYNHSSGIRVSADYALPQIPGARLRAGFSGVATAAPDETVTPLLPEQDRNYITVGAGLPVWRAWTIDAAYARVNTPGRRGRIVERSGRNPATQSAAALNTGVYSLGANVFSVSLKGSF